MSVEMVELSKEAAQPVRTTGLLQQNRVFLDYFWDLAKPDQEVRLQAVKNLIEHLKSNDKDDELEYTLKRLVDGLGHTRETARPGFSLALGQLLSAFDDITLESVLGRINDKHDVNKVKKKLVRNALFGNLFGALALQQSGRLAKEPQAVLGCVKLLQSLTEHRQHLKDLPNKTMMDILHEIPEEVFEEVLLGALKTDLESAFQTPEQLQLLLVALQRFPHTLKPKKLKKLLGSSTIINAENIPKLTELLKTAGRSVKKECVLPPVALDLLKLSLREDSFQLFWKSAIVDGLLKDSPGPSHYLSLRLLGSSLPLLSADQLREVLSSGVMVQYGHHVISSQKEERFKMAPEMEAYVSDFMQGCQESDRQLAVMVGFSSLAHQGYPVVPSVWRVVQHLQPEALQSYVTWLKNMFLNPQMENLLEFSSNKQKRGREVKEPKESPVSRLRKWIVSRLASIVDNHNLKKPESLIMDVARFVFFHAFFTAKKKSSDIPETGEKLAVPLEEKTRLVIVNSFFGLLMSMHHMPPAGDSAEVAVSSKRVLGVTADGTMWIHHLVQFADFLLNQPKHVQNCHPFSPEQRQAWDGMMESVSSLTKKSKKGQLAEGRAFQQLFLLVGIHLFKAPDELLDIMKDLQSCMDKAQEKKAKKRRRKQDPETEEPEWVEVLVDILLSLLSQQSRHIRQVCKTVFSSVCPHVTAAALTAIIDVLHPDKDDDDEEDSAVMVTDDRENQKSSEDQEEEEEEEEDEEMEVEKSDEDDSDDDDDSDDMDEDAMVDQDFRLRMMKALQKKNALPSAGDVSSDEDIGDEAMMELDKSLSALFTEQKKRIQAQKDVKAKLKKEKTLVREFRIKVLDLVEVFVTRQAGSPLVLGLVEPLLSIIERGMRSGVDQQEQDFLRRAADIFRNQLCRSKVYCRTADDRQGELHDLLSKLMDKTLRMSESSVALYYFSAALYVVKVLRGSPAGDSKEEQKKDADLSFMGKVDLDRVCTIFREALTSFMSRRKSPLTTQMFTDLFTRFPVLCVKLLDTAVQSITSGVRDHQQGQACVLALRALQSREVQQLLSGDPWTELCGKVTSQLAASLENAGQMENKVVKEKVVKVLELAQFLVKTVQQQKLSVDLSGLQKVLESLTGVVAYQKTGKLEDTYWALVKRFGVAKPKAEKTKPLMEAEPAADQQALPKKKKGFLPETKKRKRRTTEAEAATEVGAVPADKPQAEKGASKKNKKKQKQTGDGGAAAPQPSAAKKSKTLPADTPAKKKKKKKPKQKKGTGQN
ncbi:myb-binding protein 1A-like protein [Neosynchiropus ocellatus]